MINRRDRVRVPRIPWRGSHIRFGIARAELDAMIARSEVETLPTEFAHRVPSSEVTRLLSAKRA